MNAFFGGNGYRIVDQSSVAEDQMHFQNAWGMADEDLYAQALKIADQDHAAGKPFFLQLMTTSNHRPYTYPDGRIDIPSGRGGEGAVKYTDYAIGQFLDRARGKPWFNNTVFVFVADHTAGSAGKEDLPVANYHIPLFILAPGLVVPHEVSTLSSQIDLAPTLLALLNMDYVSTFYGRNVLSDETRPGRALLGNYQHIGLFDGKDLAILSPRRGMRRHDDALGLSHETKAGGGETVASLVQFIDGLPFKPGYKRFKIRNVAGIDDFASIHEVVARRFKRLDDEGLVFPDILLIDGGKGQRNAGLAAFRALGIDPPTVISLAKREEEIYIPGAEEPLKLSRHAYALRLLQYVRDEAHRFAQHYHHMLRRKTTFEGTDERSD